MAFNTGLACPRLASSHGLSASATRLSLRHVSSNNGGPVALSLPGSVVGMRTRSLRLFAVIDGRNDERDKREKIHEIMKAMSERVKKAATVVQVEAVRAQKQLSEEVHVGYSEDELVKVALNGVQAPVRIEISEAALKLGAEKLSYLVHEAYKDAHKNTIQSMMRKMSNISADLGVQDEDFGDEIFGFGSQ